MRTQNDIKQIRILTTSLKSGWVVEMEYKDAKSASFSIDNGKPGFDMLAEAFRSIKLQMESKQDGK